jgi:cytosine/uracil/thiamine/allantoin permease
MLLADGVTWVSRSYCLLSQTSTDCACQILILPPLNRELGGHTIVSLYLNHNNQRANTPASDVFYWLGDAVAPGNLRLGSSLVALGLSWKAALGLIAMGHFLIAIAITANGLIGAKYGIGYPVQSRAAFGFHFSYVMVVIRMIVGVFWYGVNTYTGAQCVYAVLVAIWPSFATMENHLSSSANITTKMMICEFLRPYEARMPS